jgi:hypothetical protein
MQLPAAAPQQIQPWLVVLKTAEGYQGLSLVSYDALDPCWLATQVGLEPDEVRASLARPAVFGAALWGGTVVCRVASSDLVHVAKSTPVDEEGECCVLMYESDEWYFARANFADDSHPWRRPHVTPLIESHLGPVSQLKQQRLAALKVVMENATMRAPAQVLEHAVWNRRNTFPFGYNELSEGVKAIADWWNAHAPENMRQAAYALLYRYDKLTGNFVALGDSDEPPMSAELMAQQPCMALFEPCDGHLYSGLFMRGRAHDVYRDGGTSVFFADGTFHWEVGTSPNDVDDALYAHRALSELSHTLHWMPDWSQDESLPGLHSELPPSDQED